MIYSIETIIFNLNSAFSQVQFVFSKNFITKSDIWFTDYHHEHPLNNRSVMAPRNHVCMSFEWALNTLICFNKNTALYNLTFFTDTFSGHQWSQIRSCVNALCVRWSGEHVTYYFNYKPSLLFVVEKRRTSKK